MSLADVITRIQDGSGGPATTLAELDLSDGIRLETNSDRVVISNAARTQIATIPREETHGLFEHLTRR